MNTIKIQNNEQIETYIFDKYATLSDYALMQKVGGSTILCTICIDYENPTQEDFLPLSVQYIEKMYAIGKIPQGFIKKEGKPSESEILTSRLIDRSLRPLLPKDFPYPVQITLLVMSYDGKTDIYKDAMNLASICLFLSSVPTKNKQILNAVRILRYNDAIKICKFFNEIIDSNLDLFVSGIESGITMIEMQSLKTTKKKQCKTDTTIENNIISESCNIQQPNNNEDFNEISEEKLLECLAFAKEHIAKMSAVYTEQLAPFAKPKKDFVRQSKINTELKEKIETQYGKEIEERLQGLSKTERHTLLQLLIEEIATQHNLSKDIVAQHVYAIQREIMRSMILTKGLRLDGRTSTQIRDINIESNLLPYVHGSACFTRGQTQALVTCTLGSENDAQNKDCLVTQKKSAVIFHYNFPPFSVGEAFPITSSSRRELGHGNLALKAIESNIPNIPFTIRIVSEILQSNGSSSMASVCGATLAMLGAGIQMQNMVAGIAMGLIYESETNFVILSDIMGVEDFDGDMDFKVTGNEKGFSALQLDIKIGSLSEEILRASLQQAKEGLVHILSLMREVKIEPNYEILPQIESFAIPIGCMPDIIGQGGKVIRDIIAKFGVAIDLDKENHIVTLMANKQSARIGAKEYIFEILKKKEVRKELPYKIDEVYEGMVKKILDFGVFIELPQGGNGLLRINRINHETDTKNELEIGQSVSVKILNNTHGKIELDFA
ncbi:polyribonucleotide nucleotidyltransferase [Helicobacter didelphidarum]|uniref:polyribonucleotide nucleotidyltransferase n=1 Tax=Helicobacter didelphidarum TaxID=2040648 RepID=A0A3D8III7_9HELI|nr:polyribonucleotide nucleotidyltransferase [Helicobacter didelphidarum]RDU64880.1 polyribonucleotide nucleotidyltransferase [Helicobacter didelphidarum]